MNDHIGDGSVETRREVFLDAAVEYLRARDIRRPISDVELKRISSELGYRYFDEALSLFAAGLTRDSKQNMRFAVQLMFATAEQTSTANVLHPLHLWTTDQILDRSVRICKDERIVGPLSHSQVHVLFTMGSLPSASTINQKFDDGKGWGFYDYQRQLGIRLRLEGLPVRDIPIPRGLLASSETPARRSQIKWDRQSAVKATVGYMTKLGVVALPSNTEINIAARRNEMPPTKIIDTLFGKNGKDDGMIHFRAYVDTVIGPTLARSFEVATSKGLTMSALGSSLT